MLLFRVLCFKKNVLTFENGTQFGTQFGTLGPIFKSQHFFFAKIQAKKDLNGEPKGPNLGPNLGPKVKSRGDPKEIQNTNSFVLRKKVLTFENGTQVF